MSERNLSNIFLVALAIIGALALIWLLAMWLMMAGMMGAGMGMMECCQNMGAVNWVLGLLATAGLVAAFVLLIRRRR